MGAIMAPKCLKSAFWHLNVYEFRNCLVYIVMLLIVYHYMKFYLFNLFRTLVIDDGSTTSDQNPLFYMYY